MSFSSLSFIFIFLPIFVLIHGLAKGTVRNAVLFLGSLLFYFFAVGMRVEYLALLAAAALLTFTAGISISQSQGGLRRAAFWLGVSIPVLVLAFFKYFTAISSLWGGAAKGAQALLFPLGISFYTFKNISYLHDVYAGKVPAERSFVRYGAYLMLFPQISMGPIQSYASLREALHHREVTLAGIGSGAAEFIIGLGLKTIFADRLGVVWNGIETIGYEGISTPLAWMGIAAYSMQLYFDFCGYSLMAVGIGRMLGYETPKNFDYPYTSSSMTDFWRRWHITLGTWFREHIYIPMGGNRCSRPRQLLNLLTVWLLTGIWHGNTAMFLLWGLVLFVIIAVEKSGVLNWLLKNKILSHFYMILLILLSWLIFRLPSVADLGDYLARMFPFFRAAPDYVFAQDYLPYLTGVGPLMLAGLLFCTPLPRRMFEKIKPIPWVAIPILLVIFWWAVYLIANGANNPFMYVNF